MPEQKEPSDKLKFILDNVNNWLKFAESKNAALLVANSAFIFPLLRLIVDNKTNRFLYLLFFICIVLAAISACICLFSFVPQISIPSSFTGKYVQEEHANLIFYGHIAKFTPKRYWEALRTQNIISEEYAQDKFLADIANQIVINSRIAHNKYIVFRIAIWLTVAAIIPPILTLIIALSLYAN